MEDREILSMKTLISVLSIILFAVVLRLVPHPANVAPIAAMALFGGLYLNKNYALVVPFIAMVVSDIFLGFHDTMVFVYGSFLLTGIIGLTLQKKKSLPTVFLASMFSSVLFFLITNFGVWLMGTMYMKNLNGLIQAYMYAVPFFRNTILGDLLYIGLFCAGYEFIMVVLQNKKFLWR
jgi:hypothetical protein